MDYSEYIKHTHLSPLQNSEGFVDDFDKFNEFIKKYDIKNYLSGSVGKYHILHFIYSICNLYDSSYLFIDKDDNIIMTIHVKPDRLDDKSYTNFIEFCIDLNLKSEIISPSINYKRDRVMFLIHVPKKALDLINFSCLNCMHYSSEHDTRCLFIDNSTIIDPGSFVCSNYRYNGFNKEEFKQLFKSMI